MKPKVYEKYFFLSLYSLGIIRVLQVAGIAGNYIMAVYVFPGQGSQEVGMRHNLFLEFPDYIQQAETILGYSVADICLKDSQNLLHQTEYTQPTFYIINALMYFKKLQKNHAQPFYVIGHSLGEYNALLAANVFDFIIGLKLVKKRGELMGQMQE